MDAPLDGKALLFSQTRRLLGQFRHGGLLKVCGALLGNRAWASLRGCR